MIYFSGAVYPSHTQSDNKQSEPFMQLVSTSATEYYYSTAQPAIRTLSRCFLSHGEVTEIVYSNTTSSIIRVYCYVYHRAARTLRLLPNPTLRAGPGYYVIKTVSLLPLDVSVRILCAMLSTFAGGALYGARPCILDGCRFAAVRI